MHWSLGLLLCGGVPGVVAGSDSGGGGGGGGHTNTIYRDVVIIGGGASGSYSAVRLREDYNVSVVLVEKDERLGGHVNTWVDPATGRGFDAGVQNWIDIGGARAFFTRLGVATQPNVRSVLDQVFVDFDTGKKLTNYSPPPNEARTEALRRYLAAAEPFVPILEPGWWTFPQPAAIPADLFLPFRDFIAKHNLTAGVPGIFGTTGFGMHDMLGSLTLWLMRSFNVNMVRVLLGIEPGFVPVSRKNQELYDRILSLLGPSDVLLSSTVASAERSGKGVTLVVRNSQTGAKTKIVAKKILFTPVPSDANMAPFDLDAAEKKTLKEFDYSASFVGVISHPSLPLNSSIVNTPAAAQPANWIAAVPSSPYNTRFENYPGSPYFRVIAVGDQTLTEKKAKKLIEDSLDRMVKAGTLPRVPAQGPREPVRFHSFVPHGLVSAYASEKSLKTGFIQRLQSLQGKKSTWYTGASWGVHLTTSLWIFTDTVLPKLVASL